MAATERDVSSHISGEFAVECRLLLSANVRVDGTTKAGATDACTAPAVKAQHKKFIWRIAVATRYAGEQ